MASATAIRPSRSSFVYEDLVARVKAIQQLAIGIDTLLRDRFNDESIKRDVLKFRTFAFIDPYGNRTIHEHMEQELISNVLRKYKKDYLPKYLQKWMKIGIRESTAIVPIPECGATSNLCAFVNETEFVAYGELTVWLGRYETAIPNELLLRVSVMDTIETIKQRVEERGQSHGIELRHYTTNKPGRPTAIDWERGKALDADATIMSLRLYQENCVVMAKISPKTVNDTLSLYFSWGKNQRLPFASEGFGHGQ